MSRALALLLALAVLAAGCIGIGAETSAPDEVEPAATNASTELAPPADPGIVATPTTTPPPEPVEDPPVVPPPPRAGLRADGRTFALGEAMAWSASDLPAAEREPTDANVCISIVSCQVTWRCNADNCVTRAFEIFAEPGAADTLGSLHAVVRWPTQEDASMYGVQVLDAAGAVLVNGTSSVLGAVAVVTDVAPGRYAVRVVHQFGPADRFEAGIQIAPSATGPPARDLLPDLVTLAPTDLRIANPDHGPGAYGIAGFVGEPWQALGERGCGPDERALDPTAPPVRCLRFSNAVANAGEGVLEVRLAASEGPAALAGEGQFVQRIYRADGTFREAPAGLAEFHAPHGHFHNAAANRFTVYAYDPITGVRGDALAEGRKTGICFADIGIIGVSFPGLAMAYPGIGCFAPDEEPAWWLGLAPGWYDLYPWFLNDQYVDIGEASDGTYALCSVTNQDGTLAELDLSNNEACTLFRLKGDTVEELGARPYHATS